MGRVTALGWRTEGRARAAYLLQQSALLNDVSNGFHLDALRLVDIFEGIEIACLLVLNDSDLQGISGGAEGRKAKRKCTLPNAPLPTHRKRMKWKRLTSPSKSIGCWRGSEPWKRGADKESRTDLRSTADGAHDRGGRERRRGGR